MKEATAVLGTEVIRPFTILVVPGAIVLLPYATWVNDGGLMPYWILTNAALLVFSLTVTTVFVGLLLENIGSWIEEKWDQKIQSAGDSTHSEDWYEYLSLSFKSVPVGHRYLRTIVLRLKFELSAGPALILSTVPVWVLLDAREHSMRYLLPIGMAVLAVWLLVEARNSHMLLGTLRRELLKRWADADLNPRQGSTPT